MNLLRGSAVIALLCLSASALAQQPVSPPAIVGQVLAADADTPLRRARITVAAGNWRSQPALTDNNGRFLVDVGGGGTVPYTVTVTKGGYVTVAARVERRDIQTPVLVRLPRGAAISGVVVDSSGAMVPGTRVTAARVSGTQDASTPTQYTATTDDLGEYRLAGLSRGRYEVWAGSFTALIEVPAIPPAKAATRLEEIGAVARTAVTVETAEEIGGVQLVGPDESAAEAALRALREAGTVPSNAVINVIVVGQSGVRINSQTPARATPPPRGLAAVRGRVLSAARKAVPGAMVRVAGTGVGQTLTDRDGAFALAGLTPGQYTLQANTSGETWHFGQNGPGQAGRPISLGPDQIVEGIEIVFPPARAISGFVIDEHGEPLEGARVQALQLNYSNGRVLASPVGSARVTDDRGRYRLWGLHSASYLVAASVEGLVPAGRNQTAYARMYYPGTPIVGAAIPIDLREDATANLAFVPVGLTEVQGVARDGDGPLVTGSARLIEDRRSGAVATEPRVADIATDGSFVFRNVPQGQYVVQVRGDGPGRTGLFGTQELLVGTEPANVTVRASYGTGIEGRIAFEGQMDPARGARSFSLGTVALDDRARESTSGVVLAGSEFFTISGLFGLTTFSLQGAPGDDWFLKSWTINGTDVADTGYDFGAQLHTIDGSEIVISRNGAAISGRVTDGSKPIDDYFLVVFPASRDLRLPLSRRAKLGRASLDGTFRVGGLPPGDYFVAAVSRLLGTRDGGEWQNPDVLLQLERRAERITLSEGQAATISLRLIER